MNNKIMPRKLAGFWELEPEKEMLFEEMIDKIKSVFAKHCFMPLDTPAMELSEILLAKSGGDVDKEVYRFTKGSTDACLRYDLTVPLARFVAANENTLAFPFKRFQIGKVYRGERPQKGRFREFYQCDADVIGDGELSLVNDAECIKLYKDVFDEFNLKGQVKVSNRKVLFGLAKALGLEEKFGDAAIIMDKLDKIGNQNVEEQLLELGCSKTDAAKLIELTKISGYEDAIEKASRLSNDEEFICGLNELKSVLTYARAIGLSEDDFVLDFGIIRGHNYYTGTVFEGFIDGCTSAIGGGGRYENLAEYFTDRKLPGVGMSIGMSRLFDYLDQSGYFGDEVKSATQVAIIPLGDTLLDCLNICAKLQANGVKAEVFAENKSFKSKMKEANRKRASYALIMGEDEVKNGVFALKNMSTGEQESLTEQQLLNKF